LGWYLIGIGKLITFKTINNMKNIKVEINTDFGKFTLKDEDTGYIFRDNNDSGLNGYHSSIAEAIDSIKKSRAVRSIKIKTSGWFNYNKFFNY
jgi:hypothetical protein